MVSGFPLSIPHPSSYPNATMSAQRPVNGSTTCPGPEAFVQRHSTTPASASFIPRLLCSPSHGQAQLHFRRPRTGHISSTAQVCSVTIPTFTAARPPMSNMSGHGPRTNGGRSGSRASTDRAPSPDPDLRAASVQSAHAELWAELTFRQIRAIEDSVQAHAASDEDGDRGTQPSEDYSLREGIRRLLQMDGAVRDASNRLSTLLNTTANGSNGSGAHDVGPWSTPLPALRSDMLAPAAPVYSRQGAQAVADEPWKASVNRSIGGGGTSHGGSHDSQNHFGAYANGLHGLNTMVGASSSTARSGGIRNVQHGLNTTVNGTPPPSRPHVANSFRSQSQAQVNQFMAARRQRLSAARARRTRDPQSTAQAQVSVETQAAMQARERAVNRLNTLLQETAAGSEGRARALENGCHRPNGSDGADDGSSPRVGDHQSSQLGFGPLTRQTQSPTSDSGAERSERIAVDVRRSDLPGLHNTSPWDHRDHLYAVSGVPTPSPIDTSGEAHDTDGPTDAEDRTVENGQ
jgi:hypothetical protein